MVVVDLGEIDARDCEPVAAALEQFTPSAEALRPGLHAFGARGPSRCFGGERALVELVAQATADSTPSARSVGVGVADGFFAAGLAARLARVSERTEMRSPVAAQPSTERSPTAQSPAVSLSLFTAVLVVPPEQGRQFLAGLPLTSLSDPVSPLYSDEKGTEVLLDVLWRLGIRTLGDLAALSESDMLGRFGWPGLLAYRLVCGLDDRPQQVKPAPTSSAVEAEIDPPAERIETVAFTARALADDMVSRLARDGLDCVSIGITAESDSGHASNRRWRHEFRFNAADIVDRVRWQLEGWHRSPDRPTGPVTLIRIAPCVVSPADGRQLGMWGAKSDADERAARALARVQGLLGAEAVTVPRLAGGRRPADIGRRVPYDAAEAGGAGGYSATALDGGRGKKSRGRKPPRASRTVTTGARKAGADKATEAVEAPWPGRLPPPQPAVVLERPEPITVTDCEGNTVTVGGRGEASAAPWQVTDTKGRSRMVVAWAGPWPLDERWWRQSARRRQARFQLVLDDGSAHLCVLESGRWQREATYD